MLDHWFDVCLDYWSVLLQEALVISKVIWIHLEDATDNVKTLGTWRFMYRVPIDGDSYRSIRRGDFGDIVQLAVLGLETNAYYS